MASEPVRTTRPVAGSETVLRNKFAESLVGQSDLMDKLAQQLITLELAVPGIYATALKLTAGDDATITLDSWVIAAFVCWFVALVLALVSLIPRTWQVDPTVLRRDAGAKDVPLGLEDFYRQSAAYKRRLLIPSTLLFAIGIALSAWSVF